jgi:hypothetical protein
VIEPVLKSQLEPVARRRRRLHLWSGLAICWTITALLGLGLLLLRRATDWNLNSAMLFLAFGGLVVAVIIWRRSRRGLPDFRALARQIEEQHPELHALLLTAVEQKPDPHTGKLGYLQQRVVREAIVAGLGARWADTVSNRRLAWTKGAHLAALAMCVGVLFCLRSANSLPTARAGVSTGRGFTVTPGDTSVERGSPLVVLVRFDGKLPADATLVVNSTPDSIRQIPLAKNLDDPVFGGSIPEVTTDLLYHIEFSRGRTRAFKVTVFEHPRLERADAAITFPEYTRLGEKRIEDTRRVSAVEGSLLDLSLQLNKPVASAKLIAKDKSAVALAVDPQKAAVALKQFPLTASKSYDLQLVDADGRTNKVPAQFIIEVLKNRAPELKIAAPRGDQRVSPLEEIGFQAEAWDDFGLQAYGLTYTLAGKEPTSITLGEASPAKEKRQFSYLLSLEDLGAEPDELVSWFIWADDIGADGNVRRTASDMFFAEVRPFEEIFRQGQSQEGDQQSGQQQGNQGNQTQKLAELQKQIINATWKLQRDQGSGQSSNALAMIRRYGLPPAGSDATSPQVRTPPLVSPAQYKKDIDVVRQSQEKALEQAEALSGRVQDPRFKPLVQSVQDEMEKALKHLIEAGESSGPLPLALSAEQAAYQALLKLSAREYQVAQSRSRNRGGGGGAGQPNQRQLEQLEFKQAENRYETQRQASPQQSAEQREQLAVLNRLKELAQRQQDLNGRLKELQTAMQEAKTDEEREEIRRQLKRLRDEEREMLADVDELRQRMDRPENQSRMAEARQQLDQTRDQVQRAAQALDKESVPQALTAGTRAQRDLQELRDDFRKKNSGQFAEDMRQMRGDARQLAQKQDELGRKLESTNDNKRKTLGDSADTKALAEQLQQQTGSLTNLLDRMRTVSEQAEVAEPLLSKQLYDTLRKTSQDDAKNLKDTKTDLADRGLLTRKLYDTLEKAAETGGGKSLEITAELLRSGYLPQANQLEQRARGNIDELKRGVERAAESVLGDEVEALRMAKRELEDLTQQVENELAQAEPNQASEKDNPGTPGGNDGQNAKGQTNAVARADGQRGQTNQRDPSAQKSAGRDGAPQTPASQSGQGQRGQDPQQNGASQNQEARQGDAQGQAQGGAGQGGKSRQTARNGQRNGAQNGGAAAGQNPADGGGQRARAASGLRNFFDQAGADGGGNGAHGPIAGPDYTNWSERLGNVEELIDIPELRNEVARIRDRARAMRDEIKRHSKEPQWPLVKAHIATPLAEVRNRVAEELTRRESSDSLVPIDRDPVPNKFSELVRRYYEKLGTSE